MNSGTIKNCVMVLSNPFKPDYRVFKEANSLINNKIETTIIAWDRECAYPIFEKINGIKIERIRLRSTYGTGILKLNKIFLFWIKAIQSIKRKRMPLVHCHDLDTLIVGAFLKTFYGIKVIYDTHENFPNMMLMSTPKFIVQLVKLYERFLLNFVDRIIVASSVLASELKQKINIPITVIGNWHYFQKLDENAVWSIRKKYIKDAKILVTYIGGLDLSRSIIPMIEAVKLEPNVRFLICGKGAQQEKIKDLAAKINNVDYIGEISLKMVPYFTAASDVIYYVMNFNSPIANYNAPNSLGFALILGKPMIASDNGELGKIIHSTNCGVLVHDNKVDSLLDAIKTICDPQKLDELSKNAFEAGRKYYNWEEMEKLFVAIYHQLLLS